jgi:hypothetical protein
MFEKIGTGGSLKFKYPHNTGTKPPGAGGSARTEEQTGLGFRV